MLLNKNIQILVGSLVKRGKCMVVLDWHVIDNIATHYQTFIAEMYSREL